MARQQMVTRTVDSTKVSALCVDITTQETLTQEYNISGKYADDEKGNTKLLKATKEVAETDTIKVVSILSKEAQETLMGMTEQEFMSMAKVLPPRSKKED